MKELKNGFSINSRTVIICVLVLTAVVMSPALKAGFLSMDDDTHLYRNPSVQALDGSHFKEIFIEPVNRTYIPLSILSFALEYQMAKDRPFLYHLDNLLLHLMVTSLVLGFALRVGLSPLASGIAALLFGIHPMHVEAVAWVTARKDVLYSLFYLLAMHQYWTWLTIHCEPVKQKIKTEVIQKRRRAYLLTVIFGVLSLLAKPMALSLPLIFLLCDGLFGRKVNKQALIEKIPHFLYMVPIAGITYALNQRVPVTDPLHAALVWVWTSCFYLWKFFWPLKLSIIYTLPGPVSPGNPVYFLSIGMLAGIIILAVRFRENRLFLFALLYYFFSAFFLFRFDDAVDITLVADRYMYLPSLGICLWLAERLNGFLQRAESTRGMARWAVPAGIFLLFAGLGEKTFLQSYLWQDEIRLWSQAIVNNQQPYYAHRNRGYVYMENEQPDLAMKDFNASIAFKSDFAPAYFNRGVLYRKMNKLDESISDYTRAIELDPVYADPYNNRAVAYLMKKQYDRALADLNEYISRKPGQAEAYFNRGKIFLMMGKNEDAVNDLSRFLEKYQYEAKGYYLRGLAYRGLGREEEARRDLERVLRIEPGHKKAAQALSKLR